MTKSNAAFAGRRGFWLRELSDCAEPDFSGVIDTLQQYAGGNLLLCPKVMDGITWQGRIDPKTPLGSVADVMALGALCASRGVTFAPVVVPRGEAGEAAAHAAVAAAVGSLVVDIEAGTGFYDQSQTSTIPAYWAALRNGAPGAYLVSQPDPRNLEDVFTSSCVPFMDGIAGQHYVGWTAVGWTDVATEVARFKAIRAFKLDTYATLYGADDTALAGEFWAAVLAAGALGLQVFRFGVMGAAQLQWSGGLALPAPITPPAPVSKPLDLAARLQLVGYVAGGSGVTDLTTWLSGYSDTAAAAITPPSLARLKRLQRTGD